MNTSLKQTPSVTPCHSLALFVHSIYLRQTPVFYRVVTVLVRADCTSDDISSIGVVEWVPAKS